MAKLTAIILAAGKGSRMGGPKMLRELNGKSFRQLILESIRDLELSEVITVVSPDLIAYVDAAESRIVINPAPEDGMLSSLRAAVNAASNVDGYLVIPVDHPFVSTDTYRTLIDAFQGDPTRIVKPTFNGQSGHPVIIPQFVAGSIPAQDSAGGLQAILHQFESAILRIPVSDSGILRNVNEPADLT